MKSSTNQYLYSVLRQAAHEFSYLAKKFMQTLMRTPLPKILLGCIALALLITLIPLALTLFAIFVLLKLLLVLLVLAIRKSRRDPRELPYVSPRHGKNSQ